MLANALGPNFTKDSMMILGTCLAYLFNVKKDFESDLTGKIWYL